MPGSSAEKKWYVVHTHAGFEQKAKQALEENIRRKGLQDSFGEILVPVETIQDQIQGGKTRTTRRAMLPSYLLIQMDLNDRAWHCVMETPKITRFIGNETKPPPVPDSQVDALKMQLAAGDGRPKAKLNFEVGEQVRVTDGPFSGFNGVVEEVKPEKSRLSVSVSIFGRATPIELSFTQVAKES